MNPADRNRRAIYAGLVVLACLAAGQFVVLPWLDHWSGARARIAAARAELTTLETQVRRVTGQRKRLDDVLGPSVGKPLPNAEEAQVRAIKAAGQTLQMSGMQAISVRPSPLRALREVPGVAVASIQVEGQGMFMQIPQCLAAIRNAEPLLLVEKLSIGPSQRQPGYMALTLVLGAPAKQEAVK